MKIYLNKENLLLPTTHQHIENRAQPFQGDRLIGGGDEDSWLDCLFEKIENFFVSIFDFFAECFFGSEAIGDRKWVLNPSNISLKTSLVKLPEESKAITAQEMIDALTTGLNSKQKEKLTVRINRSSPEVKKHLQAIIYKFKDLSEEEKIGIRLRLHDAFKVCIPTWIRVAKKISDELYLSTNNAQEKLLQLIEDYKSDLLNKIFEELGKNSSYHWNLQSMVRNKYGDILGLDQSISKRDQTYSFADDLAKKIKNRFLYLYKRRESLQQLVSSIQQRTIHQKINFFDDLVQIIELKDNMGNLEAKKYVQENLFESEDLINVKIKEEAIYLLLESIGIVTSNI